MIVSVTVPLFPSLVPVITHVPAVAVDGIVTAVDAVPAVPVTDDVGTVHRDVTLLVHVTVLPLSRAFPASLTVAVTTDEPGRTTDVD